MNRSRHYRPSRFFGDPVLWGIDADVCEGLRGRGVRPDATGPELGKLAHDLLRRPGWELIAESAGNGIGIYRKHCRPLGRVLEFTIVFGHVEGTPMQFAEVVDIREVGGEIAADDRRLILPLKFRR